jgi:hypothetical protein
VPFQHAASRGSSSWERPQKIISKTIWGRVYFIFLLRALAENLGIKLLDLGSIKITDEGWSIMCQSLASHPAIECLDLDETVFCDINSEPSYRGSHVMLMSVGRKRSLVEMLKVNTTTTKIEIGSKDRDESVWRSEIEPRLEMNKFRSRIFAVKKTQGTLRAPLFGRAVHTIDDNATFLYMMVKGNVDVFAGLARVRTRRVRKRTRYGK